MDRIEKPAQVDEPLVELAPDEAVLPALMQSAHPVEFIESNAPREQPADADRR